LYCRSIYLARDVWELNADSLTFGGTKLTVNGSEDGTDLSAKMIAGLNASIAESIKVGGRYRYIWTGTGTAFTEDVTVHIVKVNLLMRF
jgi:opacity protein-like surface antigen